jgi:ABC-type transport system involved in multi-copper enzyme maturation permease subunit
MSTTATLDVPLTESPADSSSDELSHTAHKVTFARITSSEWLKFRTVRSNLVALTSAAVAAIAFGALFSSLSGTDQGPDRLADGALSLSLGGFQISQMIVAILGVALVAGEYQTGLIRTWFAAAPDRLRVLAAKVGVYGGTVFAVTLIAALLAFLIGQAVFPDAAAALTLTDDGVLQAIVGTALYAAAISAIGVGLGFLLRSTAAGAGAIVTTLMIAPIMVNLLPDSIGDPIGKILPSNAGTAMTGIDSTSPLLSSGWGAAVLCAWVVVTVGAAALVVRFRDA